MRQRTYFHVDMDAFFVSVEELFDPTLKGKPVVVGGKANERGVVAAASYAARKFGVHSAMPLRTAAKLCPQAIFVEGHPSRYREYSEKVHKVLLQFTPTVEMASIDEAYLDMTGTERLHGPPLKAAHSLHEAMKRETDLNCSIGIAGARVVAKICSDQAKPNGIVYVMPGCEATLLAQLEVRKIPGVGKVTDEKLRNIGIRYVRDLTRLDDSTIRSTLGDWGLSLVAKARGQDAGGWYDAEVGADTDPKSVSHEHTFDTDVSDRERLESTLARLCEMVCRRVREHQLHARKVQLKLRFTDFTTITRGHTLPHTTQVDSEVFREIKALFLANWREGQTVRLLGVQLASFDAEDPQLALTADTNPDLKMKDALAAVDRLRDKFGEGAVSLATGLRSRFLERTHENPASLPGKAPEKPDPNSAKK